MGSASEDHPRTCREGWTVTPIWHKSWKGHLKGKLRALTNLGVTVLTLTKWDDPPSTHLFQKGKDSRKSSPKKSGKKAPKRIPINQTGFHEMSLVGFWSLLILDKNGIHSHLFKNHCLFSEGLAQSTSLEILILAESTLTCGSSIGKAGWPGGSWPENVGPGWCGPGKSGKQKLGTLWWFYMGWKNHLL